jgi:toxin ParE1/3/4
VTKYRIAGPAETAIIDILTESERSFGPIGAERYEALLRVAFGKLADGPTYPPSRSEGNSGVRSYHLKHSRNAVDDPPGRVKNPRHAVIYEIAGDGCIDILGLIHDRQSRPRALRAILKALGRPLRPKAPA